MQKITMSILVLLALACQENNGIFARSYPNDRAISQYHSISQGSGRQIEQVDRIQGSGFYWVFQKEAVESRLKLGPLTDQKTAFIFLGYSKNENLPWSSVITQQGKERLHSLSFRRFNIANNRNLSGKKWASSDILPLGPPAESVFEWNNPKLLGNLSSGDALDLWWQGYYESNREPPEIVAISEASNADLSLFANNYPCLSGRDFENNTFDELLKFAEETGWEMDESPAQEAIDLDEYLSCFDNIPDAGAVYTIKVMVDIPVDANPNSLIYVGATGLSVGHVFLNISKSNDSKVISQTIGFYPASDYKSLTLSAVTSKLADDGKNGLNHEFNASLLIDGWNSAEFKALLNQLRLNSTMKYEIDGFNCANFVGSCLNAVKPNTLSSVSTTGINPLNPSELISIPWSPNGVYKALVDQKTSNAAMAAKIVTGVMSNAFSSSGPCF